MAPIKQHIDYEKIAQLESFKALSKRKNKFLWSLTVIFLVIYMILPVLTSYTDILHKKAIGEITWVWIYSLGLFFMTWGLAHLYVVIAGSYDRAARAVIDEYEGGKK